ncbi:metallophosphoesterase family protein [bacterium]|nr:metallophosphoesterase family protein [bacterium]
MAKLIKANKLLLVVFVLIVALCFSMVMIAVSQASALAAETTWTEDGSVSIGHITDTHYYPLRLCYTGNVTSSEDDDYFYNYIMAKNTKMWLEAETIFDTSLLAFEENTPEYIVLSGDVGQDGELLSHVDVANKLRRLQNTVRAASGNDKFQIFVILGNHDLYNEDTFRFDNASGTKEVDLYTARMDATKIYAGLGYPNMTDEEASVYYADMASDLPIGYTYVRSNLSSDFTYTWQFLKKDGDNTITYDMSVENADDITMAKLLDANLVNTINNSSRFASSKMSYTYSNGKGGTDLSIGEMTYIAARNDGKYTCLGLDVVISNAVDGHVLGGQVQNSTQAWLEENKTFLKPQNDTVITGISHHSIVPHWRYEEEITTGFIIYNWQEVSDFLADLGVRYVYTGHMHANSTVSRVSFNGNQITDFETAANLSVESQIKITQIKYGTYGSSYAEKAMLSAYPNKSVLAVALFDTVFANDKYGYVAKNKIGEFLNYNTKTINQYSQYAQRRIYDNAVENTVSSFLKPSITKKLGDMVSNIKFELGFMSIDLGDYANDVVKLADNLIKQISLVVLKDYTYKGDNPLFKIEENKVFGFLEEMIYNLIYSEVAEETGIFDVFMYCYMGHNTGYDVNTVEDMPKAYRAVLKEVKNGNFVKFLVESLLDRDKGLMRIIEGLCTTTLDLSDGLSKSFTDLISSAGTILGFSESKSFKLDLSKFNLGEILKVLGSNSLVTGLIDKTGFHLDLVNNTLPEIIDDLVNKYITDSFTQSLGEYAYNVCVAFGSDGGDIDVHDDNNGNGTLITVYKGEAFTYIAKDREEIISIENGKLPSMLTTNFGANTATSQHFTYFTDRRVNDGAIEYVKVNEDGTYNKTAATTKAANTEVYGTTKPLIDLGIWCQSGYVEMSRHTIELTTLTASTTYAYRVGSSSKGYWSPWYTFTTGPADDKGAFSALITSDLQSSTESAYQRIDTIYRSILGSEQFSEGINFLINPGDATDNSRNLSQFKWFINSSPDIYASYSTVIATGNHDEKYFSLDKASNVEYYGGVSANANTDEYNYLQFHYNYVLSAQQNELTGFYYSFDYSGVHFTVLNTSDIVDDKLSNTQYQWLLNDLKNTTKKKVVIMHKSLYSEGSHSYDKDVVGMRAQLTPVFAENGVSLVIAGHDHTYTETFYLDANGKKILTNANSKNVISDKGTMYLTMGTFGEKFYNLVENPLVKSSTGWNLHSDGKLADPVFGKLSFDGDKLTYYGYQYLRTYNEDGSLKGGEIVEIKKAMDWTTLISLGLVGLTIISMIIAIVVTVSKKRK